MKHSRVYLFPLILLLFCAFSFTGCARKSGCPATTYTPKPVVKKNGKPKKKASMDLFNKKTNRKMKKGK
ncbi:MAG: hypothetical protein ACJAZ9_000106 [Neolewinella sp.]|jgi:hypothetical protein